jgi:hypothetical protein
MALRKTASKKILMIGTTDRRGNPQKLPSGSFFIYAAAFSPASQHIIKHL